MINRTNPLQQKMRGSAGGGASGGAQQFSGGPFAQYMDPNSTFGRPPAQAQRPMFTPQEQQAHDASIRGTLADPNLHRFVQSPWGDPGVMKDWTPQQQQQAAAAGPAWHSSDGMSGSVGPHGVIGLAGGAHSGGRGGHQVGVDQLSSHIGGVGVGGGGGIGGGSWGGGNLGGLGGVGQGQVGQQLSQYQNQANQSNANRYNQLLQMAGQLSNAGMAREQQRQNFELGRVDQHAISSGLGNTTVLPSLERGAIDQSAIRQQEIGDQGLKTAMGIVERRTDQQPDYGLLAQLAGRPGASGGGGGSFGFPSGGGIGGGGGGGGHQNSLGSIFDSNGLPGVNPLLDSGSDSNSVNGISSGAGGPSGPAGKQALIQQLVAMMNQGTPAGGSAGNSMLSGPEGGMQFDQYGNPIDPNTGQPLNNSGRAA